MLQLNIKNLQKSYGDTELLQDISFHLTDGERVGIVGANGCGKSTLLHIIAGLIQPDGGEIRLSGGGAVGMLSQDGRPVLESAEEELFGLEQQHLKFMQVEASRLEHTSTLSGGEQIKLALSKLLSSNPHLLLLDEPTNNLDLEGINALIQFLYAYNGAILAVSHDRYFLDATVSRILEIEDGRAVDYAGNYSYYREEKKRLFQERIHRYQSGQKEQKRIESAMEDLKQWSEKAHRDSTKVESGAVKMGLKEKRRAKAKKMDKRIKSNIKRLERLKSTSEERPREEKTVYFSIQNTETRGKRILQATGLSKSFGSVRLFYGSDFSIARGEKVAVFGKNGCGKTTLIRMIQGLEEWDSGDLWRSTASLPYVLPQAFEEFPPEQTVLQYLTDTIRPLTGKDRTVLNNMGLGARHLAQQIQSLSFGEQMKLKLAEPILEQRDFIILDEPTNHLDLHAREMLEETLSHYEGTLLVVSHDIYFLQKICDKVLLFENQRIRRLENTFADFLRQMGDSPRPSV